jgi:hypothetical protein
MKKLIVLGIIMAVMVLVAAPVHAQTPTTDLKPTFISPTPGLYVHGWPAFTVTYPKEWVEVPLAGPGAVFEAVAARPDSYASIVLAIGVSPSVLPLEDWAKLFMPVWVEYFTDIKVLSDKPSQLKGGTLAREVEFDFVPKVDPSGRSIKNGTKQNGVLLVAKKDATWVSIMLGDDRGKPGEDLRRIAYSLTFQPGREEPVKVPPDVRAFLDMYCTDVVSHDVTAMMAHFSDRFRHSGMNKAFMEQFWRNDPASPIQRGTISCEATVTVFEAQGDKAYVDGFMLDKARGDANALKVPMVFQQIINEHGQWKWYGNQK